MGFFSDIFGGGEESSGAEDASRLAQQAYRETAPYRQAGSEAMGQIRDVYLTGERPYTASPGYDFVKDETMRALERYMSAQGLLGSGRAIRGAARYAKGLASDEYNQGFNRLASIAGIGQTGLNLGQNALLNQAGYLNRAGQARQSGYDRTSAAAINTLAGLAGMYG